MAVLRLLLRLLPLAVIEAQPLAPSRLRVDGRATTCSGAVALRVVCPAQITVGVPDYAVGLQVAENPVGAAGRDLGHRAHPPASLTSAHSVIRGLRARGKGRRLRGGERWPP